MTAKEQINAGVGTAVETGQEHQDGERHRWNTAKKKSTQFLLNVLHSKKSHLLFFKLKNNLVIFYILFYLDVTTP